MKKYLLLSVLFAIVFTQSIWAQNRGNYWLYVVPGSNNFRIILASNVDGILEGIEREFNLIPMSNSIFNNQGWFTGDISQSEFDFYYRRGFKFVGIFDTTDGDYNIAVVDISRNLRNIEWKGFYYTPEDRIWKVLNNDWIRNNMFHWWFN